MFARKKNITKILIRHSKEIELKDRCLIRKSQSSKSLGQRLKKPFKKKGKKKVVKKKVKEGC